MKKCSGCFVDLYCSAECQRQAWPSHKSECKAYFVALGGQQAFGTDSKQRPRIQKMQAAGWQECLASRSQPAAEESDSEWTLVDDSEVNSLDEIEEEVA